MKRVNHWLHCDSCPHTFGPAKNGRSLIAGSKRAGWKRKPDLCPTCQEWAATPMEATVGD